jgi:hypothetical protein
MRKFEEVERTNGETFPFGFNYKIQTDFELKIQTNFRNRFEFLRALNHLGKPPKLFPDKTLKNIILDDTTCI